MIVLNNIVKVRVIIFDSVLFLSRKSNQTEKKLKKLKPVQTDRFGFGSIQFFRTKTGWNRFGSFFPIWLCLAWFFCFFRFGSVFSVSVWFFRFQTYKTEPISFFKILIGFFYSLIFLVIFLQFFQFNQFFNFFSHP
jgi:hypothetical protein